VPELADLLSHVVDQRASDIYLKAGSPPHLRVDGKLQAAPFEALSAADLERTALAVLTPDQAETLAVEGEVDFAYSVAGVGRFRVHAYRQRGSVALVLRRVTAELPRFDELGLPSALERLTGETRGLVVVTGPAGSGRTTTVNAVVDLVNRTAPAHIVTIEDPIEYLHTDRQAIVSQREMGTDVHDVAGSIRRMLRHGPDVLVVGELAHAAVVHAALDAAQAGQLVLGTMTTLSAAETVARLADFFPPHQQRQARHQLASSLRIVVCQRLLERVDGHGRVAAVEVLVNTPKVFECLVDPERSNALERLMAEGAYHGMQTFDQALVTLCRDGLIAIRDALAVASEPEELRLSLQSAGVGSV
jgi:twitching motility protein PilT